MIPSVKNGKAMVKQYIMTLWNEMKRDSGPLFPIGILLVATVTLTFSHDDRIISFISSKFPHISDSSGIRFYDIYCFVVLFILPAAYVKLTGRKLKDFGLCWGKLKFALPLFVLFFILLTLFGYCTSRIDSFKGFYGSFTPAGLSAVLLLFATNFIFMWAWEFMYRGFLLQGLRDYVGGLAIFIQLVPFVLLHLGKPPFELYGSIVFGLAFGYYAYVTRSFVYAAFLHAYFATIVCVLL
jgi:hypothetical protein